MSRKRDRRLAQAREEAARRAAAPPTGTHDEATRVGRLRARLAQLAVGAIAAPFLRIHAALFLAFAGVVLIIAWQSAPQRLLDAHRYARFSGFADGRIVDSWVAMNWRPEDMSEGHLRWHAYSTMEACVVVEFDAGQSWGAERRAFCGNRLPFREEDDLADLDRIAPDIPFGWRRDARGFVEPELRVGAAGRQWLERSAPYSTFFLGKPEPRTALEALDRQLNHPVDAAVASWSRATPAFPVAFDPSAPESAMPRAYVLHRKEIEGANWIVLVMFGGVGLAVWFAGMRQILPTMPARARIVLSCVPLLTLPWWSERFPDALRSISKDLSSVVRDVVGDLDRTGRVVGTAPEDATLARGERLVYPIGRAPYAATFGRMAFTPPPPAPLEPNDALRRLCATAASEMRALPAAEQSALLMQATADKYAEIRHAGLVFVPAARDLLVGADTPPEVRRAARHFLSEWVVQPIVEPRRDDPDFVARAEIYTALAELPIPEISIMAKSVADRAREKRR